MATAGFLASDNPASAGFLAAADGGIVSIQCCHYKLLRCSDDVDSGFTLTREEADGHHNQIFRRTATGVCYYLSDPEICSGPGSDPGAGFWYLDCDDCDDVPPTETFVCDPDLGGALTQDELDAQYPDVYAQVINPQACACYVQNNAADPNGNSYAMALNGLAAKQFLLVPDPAIRVGGAVGHSRTYQLIDSSSAVGDLFVRITDRRRDNACAGTVAGFNEEANLRFDMILRCYADTTWTYELPASGFWSLTDTLSFLVGSTVHGIAAEAAWGGAGGAIVATVNTFLAMTCDPTGLGHAGDGITYFATAPGIP